MRRGRTSRPKQQHHKPKTKWKRSTKFLITLPLLPLIIAGGTAVFLILWSSFNQASLDLFQNDGSSAIANTEDATRPSPWKVKKSKTSPALPISGLKVTKAPKKDSGNSNKPSTITSSSLRAKAKQPNSSANTPIVLKTQSPRELLRVEGNDQRIFVSGNCDLLSILGSGNQVVVEHMNEGDVVVIGNRNYLQIGAQPKKSLSTVTPHAWRSSDWAKLTCGGELIQFFL